MTVFSQLAAAFGSGNWFSWWEEVQFSGCYKYSQCLQSPAMLQWQKLLKVFSLHSKSFRQSWQGSENLQPLLMLVESYLGEASLCSGATGEIRAWTRWVGVQGGWHRGACPSTSPCILPRFWDSWCHGVFILLVAKPNNVGFVVTSGILRTMSMAHHKSCI